VIKDYLNKKKRIAVVGLGYVGLPLAVLFSEHFDVIGFEVKEERINALKKGMDSTGEVSRKRLRSAGIEFTTDPKSLSNASLIVVAVPTPIDEHKTPDLTPLREASEIVGSNIKKGSVVVYESTVYPGVTEEFCVPIIEERSGLRCGKGFKVGYSPERVNPGDKEHGISGIVKVVSAQDSRTTGLLAALYGRVVKAGIHKAPDIKTAEAAKVIENIQRDLNIALVNELSIIFNRMGLDTGAVLDAAETKWNFLPFRPGLVGGHCIGVDPYYLTFKAQAMGYHPEVILSGRRINDNMGSYIADNTVKELIKAGRSVKRSRILILGLTFKENIGDIRNTRVVDIYNELKGYGINVSVHDPHANEKEVLTEHGITLLDRLENGKPYDGIILAVKHDAFKKYSLKRLKKLCRKDSVLIDVKGFFDKKKIEKTDFRYWGL
jgi:UDP-N-acetyl-D-galactosamine dehydrogenase